MFDSSMSELILVFVIGLLILGPERLPKVAAQIGRWVAKARRTANQLRYQLEREVALEEVYKAQKKKPRAGAAKSGDSATADAKSASDSSSTPAESAATSAGAEGTASPDESAPQGASAAVDPAAPTTTAAEAESVNESGSPVRTSPRLPADGEGGSSWAAGGRSRHGEEAVEAAVEVAENEEIRKSSNAG